MYSECIEKKKKYVWTLERKLKGRIYLIFYTHETLYVDTYAHNYGIELAFSCCYPSTSTQLISVCCRVVLTRARGKWKYAGDILPVYMYLYNFKSTMA